MPRTKRELTAEDIPFDGLAVAPKQTPSTIVSPDGSAPPIDEARRHKREPLEIPVRLQGYDADVHGWTRDISVGGVHLLIWTPLKAGAPLAIRCSFGDVCYLNLSGQVAYCVPAQQGTASAYAAGIKFAALRDWEQIILLSALKELNQTEATRRKSFLSLLVSEDSLAAEAARLFGSAGDGFGLADGDPSNAGRTHLGDLPGASPHAGATTVSPISVPLRDLLPQGTERDLALELPTYTLLVNGEELDTHRYEYCVYADKLITEPRVVIRLLRQVKLGNAPHNYQDYIFARYCIGGKDTNTAAMEAAYLASREFRYFPISKRMKILTDAYNLLLANQQRLMDLMVAEGHPRKLAEWELSGMEQIYRKPSLDFYKRHLSERIGLDDTEIISWKRKPDGVVCVSPPRNAPCSSSIIAGFALLGGNTLIIKPPLRSPVSTVFLWRHIFQEALTKNGAPPGTLNIVLGNSEMIVNEWIANPHVNDILYFGDSSKGLEIGHRAFQNGKKPILELSGNDMMFIWKDAALHEAVHSLLDGFLGSTQICMVPKKAFVHEDIYEAFEQAFLAEVQKLKIGLPSDPEVSLSPVVKMREFYEFLEDALQKRAKLLCGGIRLNHQAIPDQHGCFIAPTVLRIEDFRKAGKMRCVREENFFPLIPLIKVSAKDTDSAQSTKDMAIFKTMVTIANSNEYGLRVSAWVKSPFYLQRFVGQIQNSGLLRINCRHVGFPPYQATHGGTGKSGGPYGELNYVWQKTTHLQGVSLTRMKMNKRNE